MELSYNEWKNSFSQPTNKVQSSPYVGYFTLKDGEEAIVRIMHDSLEDLKVYACHWANIEGRYGWVNCPRNPRDPISMCPYCSQEDNRISYRVFIKVVEYKRDESGVFKPQAKIWDRPASFSNKIQNLLNEYGPLSDIIFKVKRSGTGNSTIYDILYTNSNVYKPEMFPKYSNAFDGYNVLGHALRELQTPEIPFEPNATVNPQTSQPQTTVEVHASYGSDSTSTPRTVAWNNPSQTPSSTSASSNQNPAFSRPKRFY